MTGEQEEYGAYLLRFWRETADSPWRFLLISVQTGQQRVFTSLESLFCYLDQTIYIHKE